MSGSNKVFIVHGHDEAVKESVARFLEKCGFEAIILHEQADGGRTIIEKIVCYQSYQIDWCFLYARRNPGFYYFKRIIAKNY